MKALSYMMPTERSSPFTTTGITGLKRIIDESSTS